MPKWADQESKREVRFYLGIYRGDVVLNGLDLFSGIGGISLALGEWVRPLAYCESDRYAQAVLLSRMQAGEIHTAPIWDDVQTLSGNYVHDIDIVYGGFPCQDISTAGAGRGLVGERSGLYWQIERLVKEIKPQFVFLENVPAIRTRGLNAVVQSLTELGYDCRWTILSAEEVGAPHLRKRWFMLAHSHGDSIREQPRRGRRPGGQGSPEPSDLRETSHSQALHGEAIEWNEPNRDNGRSEALADPTGANGERLGAESHRQPNGPSDRSDSMADAMREGRDGEGPIRSTEANRAGARSEFARPGWWKAEPELGRVAHGIPQRVDRLRGLGNAVVPLQARTAFMRLMGLETESNAEDGRGNG